MGYWSEKQIEFAERGFGSADGSLCAVHIIDTVLRDQLQIIDTGKDAMCRFCESPDRELVGFEDLVEHVMETVHFFYQPANDILSFDSREDGYQGPVEDTQDVLGSLDVWDAFESDYADKVVEGLLSTIDNDAWTYVGAPADPDGVRWEWELFADTVKHTARFVFLPSASGHHGSEQVIRFLQRLEQAYTDPRLDLIDYRPKGTSVFRGRVVEHFDQEEWNAKTLGPQESRRAAANRMSPAGVAMFYGSLDPQTAIAEIAGHSIGPRAVMGEFHLTTGIQVLDLTREAKIPGSIFDPAIRELMTMRRFLTDFVAQVSRPVIPDGREHYEYAPTQVLTEFLRWTTTRALVGIAFPSSVHEEGTNLVLFYGPGEVADLAKANERHMLTLAPQDVTYFEVQRSAAGKPVLPIKRAAPPA